MTGFLATALCIIPLLGCTEPVSSNKESQLMEAMAYGRILEINTQQPAVEKGLWLRLYEIPSEQRDCRPETDAPCANRYLLSVSTFDENPQVNVFPLQQVRRQVQAISWQKAAGVDQARVRFDVTTVRIGRCRGEPLARQHPVFGDWGGNARIHHRGLGSRAALTRPYS